MITRDEEYGLIRRIWAYAEAHASAMEARRAPDIISSDARRAIIDRQRTMWRELTDYIYDLTEE